MNQNEKETENLQEDSSETGIYEVGYLILSTTPEDKVAGEVSNIKDIIEKRGGSFISEGRPELKQLAYQMDKRISGKYQKYDDAYFGWVKFEVAKDNIEEIKAEIELLQSLLRFIIINTVRENTLVSMQKAVIRKPSPDAPERNSGELDKPEPAEEMSEEEIDEEIDKTLEDLEIK
jgi:ribosomal protein S6